MSVPQFLQQFREPDPRFSPAPIWWWSGEKLDIARMRWQMDRLAGMGIRNVVVLNLAPSGTLFCCDADDPPFLSEKWWEIFEQVCDHAREIGMFIWFYDQIGFSGANYQAELVAAHPEFSAQRIRRTVVEGTGRLRIECPGAATPLAAYVIDAHGARSVNIDGRSVSVDVSEPSKLCLVHTIRQGYDYFNRDACEKLLDTVHREFARRLPQHIGKTIVGSFQDELPDLPTWGRDFSKTFTESFGYRLEDVIHRLFELGDADSRRTRLHYHQHRANLAEQALFKPFFRWHEEHGLACGFDQQSPAREARAFGCVQKYADYIQTHRWYAAPGCDLHGNGKLHASIAFMYNRPRVWIEGFHSTGWGGTIADTFDWLLPFLQSGANLYNPHAVYYSTRLGWWEWAPPSTCWRQPYARHYKGFADMIARLTKLLSQGTHLANVGVLFPTATVQSNVGPEGHFPDAQSADQVLHRLIGSMKWHENDRGVLDELSLDFHLLDETTVEAATVVRVPSSGVPGEGQDEGAAADDAHGPSRQLGEGQVRRTSFVVTRPFQAVPAAPDDGRDARISATESRRTTHGLKARVTIDRPRSPALPQLSPGIPGEGGGFLCNGTSIRTLVLPHVAMLDDTTLVRLREFASAGGRIVAVGSRHIETPDGQTLDIADLKNAMFISNVEEASSALRHSPRDIHCPVPFLHRQLGDIHVLFVPATSGMATHVKWTDWFATLDTASADPSNYLRRAEMGLPAHARQVWRFDPIDCGVDPIAVVDGKLDLDFHGAPFALLAWSENENPTELSDPPARSIEMPLSDTWSCEYVPTLPTEYADIFDPRRPELRLPHTTDFVWKCEGREQTVRATFGIHGSTDIGPIVYSPRFGIQQDRMHWHTLGPKGHVPEEFIDLGRCEADSRRVVRTAVESDAPRDAVLAVGANAHKLVHISAQRLASDDGSYLSMWPVKLRRGENPIELTLTTERAGRLRAFWCLLRPGTENQFRRPERMIPPDALVAGSRLSYRTTFTSGQLARRGKVLVTTAAVASVHLDGTVLGRLGGFDPYRLQVRSQPFELPELAIGSHELRIDLLDPGSEAPLSVDLLAGELQVISDSRWTVSRDGAPPVPVRLYSKQENDGAAWHLYRRPHPLPETAWLEGPQPPVVLDLPTAPPSQNPVEQTFQWTIPPGATRMHLNLQKDVVAALSVDAQAVSIAPGTDVLLGHGPHPARTAVLRVKSRHLGGGVFTGPMHYEFGEGILRAGSWLGQGLRSYSGAIRMTQRFQMEKKGTDPFSSESLDLGRVRGTVEARLNAHVLGARFLPPYRFDITRSLREGDNELELLVTNTLVNFLSTWSPTRGWAPDQFECGVFGPVTIRRVSTF